MPEKREDKNGVVGNGSVPVSFIKDTQLRKGIHGSNDNKQTNPRP